MSQPHAGRFDTPWLGPLYQVTGQVHGRRPRSPKQLISELLLHFRISTVAARFALEFRFPDQRTRFPDHQHTSMHLLRCTVFDIPVL
jgi:hypothetical protein